MSADPPRTDWLDLAVMSRDDEDYQDEWGTILDEENFERLDREGFLSGPYSDRPSEAPFDGAKYHATDVNAVFSWDASADEWRVLNSGTEEQPVPGTTHHERIEAESLSIRDWNWIDVALEGADTGGSSPADGTIQQLVDDDTLLILPEGEYLFSGKVSAAGVSDFGIVGRNGAMITTTKDYADDEVFEFGSESSPARNLYMEGLDFDVRGGSVAALPIRARTAGHSVLRNVELFGQHDRKMSTGGLNVSAHGESSTVSVENYRLADGSADFGDDQPTSGDEQPPTAIYVHDSSEGTVRFEDCVVRGWQDNGLYASNSDSKIVVSGGHYSDNRSANIRVGGDDSRVVGVTAVNSSEGFSGRCLWHESGTGVQVEGCHFTGRDPDSPSHIVVVGTEAGSISIRDTTVESDGHGARMVFARLVDTTSYNSYRTTFDSCRFVGDADSYDGVSSMVYTNRALSMDGCEVQIDSASSDLSRWLLANSPDCKLEGCTASVPETVIRSYSSGDRIRLVGNRFSATDGSYEVNLSGEAHVAVGNIVENGISLTGEEAANVILS